MASSMRASWARSAALSRLPSSMRSLHVQATRADPLGETENTPVKEGNSVSSSATWAQQKTLGKKKRVEETTGESRSISFEQRGVQRLERLLKEEARARLKEGEEKEEGVLKTAGSGGGGGGGGKGDPDNNKVKLGRTLRILQERLPTLLQAPLPQDILAPNISLHLFPSTHPHLPAVSGRVAYTAALWTSPIAWNRFPLIGNVRLDILSERMVKEALGLAPHRDGAISEQLVVRWRTLAEDAEGGEKVVEGAETELMGKGKRKGQEEFSGLYIFQFDGEGRILSHTIETAQAGGRWESGVGAKVVGLTDWLLGEIKGRPGGGGACPAYEPVRVRMGSRER